MKKLQLSLILVAFLTTANLNANTPWTVGYDVTSGNPAVWAVLDIVNSNIVLRIYGSGAMDDMVIVKDPSSSLAIKYVAQTPWINEAPNIIKVIVESGVTYLGKGAFFNCDNLRELRLPQTLLEIGDSCISLDNFKGTIYCNAPIPPKVPAVSSSSLPIFTNAFVKVPNELVSAYTSTGEIINMGSTYANWWANFHANGNLFGSTEAAAVLSTPQDSIKSDQFTINLELIGTDETTRQSYYYEVTATNGVDNHHFFVIFKNDKWQVSATKTGTQGRRIPIVMKDTVSRSTESLQIDITNLTPSSNYNYSVTGYNSMNEVVFQSEGTLLTSPAKTSNIGNRIYETTDPKRYNVMGLPVDENYQGVIITENGEKILQR